MVQKKKRTNSLGTASSDCYSCSASKLECDRIRPRCGICTSQGKVCPGYKQTLTWNIGIASRGYLRGKTLPIKDDNKNLNLSYSNFSSKPKNANTDTLSSSSLNNKISKPLKSVSNNSLTKTVNRNFKNVNKNIINDFNNSNNNSNNNNYNNNYNNNNNNNNNITEPDTDVFQNDNILPSSSTKIDSVDSQITSITNNSSANLQNTSVSNEILLNQFISQLDDSSLNSYSEILSKNNSSLFPSQFVNNFSNLQNNHEQISSISSNIIHNDELDYDNSDNYQNDENNKDIQLQSQFQYQSQLINTKEIEFKYSLPKSVDFFLEIASSTKTILHEYEKNTSAILISTKNFKGNPFRHLLNFAVQMKLSSLGSQLNTCLLDAIASFTLWQLYFRLQFYSDTIKNLQTNEAISPFTDNAEIHSEVKNKSTLVNKFAQQELRKALSFKTWSISKLADLISSFVIEEPNPDSCSDYNIESSGKEIIIGNDNLYSTMSLLNQHQTTSNLNILSNSSNTNESTISKFGSTDIHHSAFEPLNNQYQFFDKNSKNNKNSNNPSQDQQDSFYGYGGILSSPYPKTFRVDISQPQLLKTALSTIILLLATDQIQIACAQWKNHLIGALRLLEAYSHVMPLSESDDSFKGQLTWLCWCDLGIAFTSRRKTIFPRSFLIEIFKKGNTNNLNNSHGNNTNNDSTGSVADASDIYYNSENQSKGNNKYHNIGKTGSIYKNTDNEVDDILNETNEKDDLENDGNFKNINDNVKNRNNKTKSFSSMFGFKDNNKDTEWDMYVISGITTRLKEIIWDLITLSANKCKYALHPSGKGGELLAITLKKLSFVALDDCIVIPNTKEEQNSRMHCIWAWTLALRLYCYQMFPDFLMWQFDLHTQESFGSSDKDNYYFYMLREQNRKRTCGCTREILLNNMEEYCQNLAGCILNTIDISNTDPSLKQLVIPLLFSAQYFKNEEQRDNVRTYCKTWHYQISCACYIELLMLSENIWKTGRTWVEVLDEFQELRGGDEFFLA